MDIEKLKQLQELKESGVLTQEEFEIEKAKLMNAPDNAEVVEKSYSQWSKSLPFGKRYLMTLGGMIPIIGLILFCVYIKKEPRYAKWCGINALVVFVIFFVLFLIMQS